MMSPSGHQGEGKHCHNLGMRNPCKGFLKGLVCQLVDFEGSNRNTRALTSSVD